MAARFWVSGGDALWSNINNWSLTSGGAGGQTVPSAADDVTFDSAGNVPCTLNTSARVAKTLTVASGYTSTITFDQQLSVSGSVTLATGFSFAGATTNKLRMIAAGTWTTNGITIPQNIEIGGTTTFTCTLADALRTSGDLLLSNTTSTIFSGAFEITADGNCTVQGSQTVTCVEDFNIGGTTTIADACVLNGAFQWRHAGLTHTGATSGTMTFVFNGTGTWQGASTLSNSVTINTAGTLTLSGTIQYLAGTITYTAGTVSVGASVLSIGSSCTIVTAGMTWNAVTLTAAVTITINSLLTGATLTLPNAAVTFAGSHGWSFATFTNTTITATRITTFTAGRTYTVTTAFTTVSAAAQTVRHTFTAASSTNLTLGPGATQDVGFLDPTNIDASLGQTIFTYEGVITTSPNWISEYRVNAPWVGPVYQLGI